MTPGKNGTSGKPMPELGFEVNAGDIAIVKAVVVAGREIKFKKPMRIPVERLGDCQLVLERIEARPRPIEEPPV